MPEYIEREAFVKWVEETYCKPCEKDKRDYNHCRCGACQYDDMILDISSFPAADVRPIVRGEWVYEEPNSANSFNGCYWCDQCHQPNDRKKNFCPNCGSYNGGGENACQ